MILARRGQAAPVLDSPTGLPGLSAHRLPIVQARQKPLSCKAFHNGRIFRPSSPPPASGNRQGADHDQREDCRHVSREYEAVYIFDSTLEDAAINDKLTRYHGLLHADGEIKTDHWGRRQLAYPIGPRENGYYVVAKFHTDPKTLPEYERALKLDDGIVRYLVTLHEHEVGAPPMSEEDMLAARRREEDDEDED